MVTFNDLKLRYPSDDILSKKYNFSHEYLDGKHVYIGIYKVGLNDDINVSLVNDALQSALKTMRTNDYYNGYEKMSILKEVSNIEHMINLLKEQ